MAPLNLRLLGGFQARLGGGPALTLPAKAQALLAYLAIRPGQAHPRDKLAALLWGDTSDAQARDSLRHAVAGLRRALAAPTAGVLMAEGQTYALDPAAADIDVVGFERAVADGTREALDRAAALYQGDLLEGLAVSETPFEEWLLAERERLRELAVEGLAKLLAHQIQAGEPAGAVQTATRLLALDPLQELVHRALMRLHARRGRRAAALRQYQVCVGVLQRELGTEPEAETRRLYREILQQRGPEPATAIRAFERESREAWAATPRVRAEVPTSETPMIGREREMSRARHALDEASRGRGQMMAIVGEAGIGKTRLAAAIAALGLDRGATVLAARCSESEQVLPFAPWVDALRAGISGLDVSERLGRVWRLELARLFPELGEPGLVSVTDGDGYLRLFEAVALLVGSLATERLLVVILEDVHWADEMSLRLLSYLGRRREPWPLLLVVTAREEELADAALLRRALVEPGIERLALSPLSESETRQLTRALGRVSSDESTLARLEERVWSTSGGNPFVVVETVRALEEAASIEGAGVVAVPGRVRNLVRGRLERLGDASRQIVEVAAVVGGAVDFEVLQRATTLTGMQTATGLEELVRRGVLHGVGDDFDFTHERIRRVVDDDLERHKRRLLHGAVGRALEGLYATRLHDAYDRLAYHYSNADELEKALTYLAGFADTAARRYAHEDAVTALRKALAHARRLPPAEGDRRAIRLVPALARSLFFLGHVDAALDVLRQQELRLQDVGDPALAGPVLFWLGYFEDLLGDHAAAVPRLERAIEEGARAHDPVTTGQAHYELARGSFWSGRPREGLAHGEAAVALLETTDQRWWLGIAHWVVGINQGLLGAFESALAAEARAGAVGEAIEDRSLQAYAAFTSGWVLAMRGEGEAAIAACRRALALSSDPVTRAQALGLLGYGYLEMGEAPAAIQFLEQSLEPIAQIRPSHAWFSILLGEAYLAAGDLDRARTLLTRGLAVARDVAYPLGVGLALRGLGRIAEAEDHLSDARTLLTGSLEALASTEARFEMARTRLELAELSYREGDRDAAAQHGRLAEEVFTASGVSRYEERMRHLAISPRPERLG